jgi:hypothetical protein
MAKSSSSPSTSPNLLRNLSEKKVFDNSDSSYCIERFVYVNNNSAEITIHGDNSAKIFNSLLEQGITLLSRKVEIGGSNEYKIKDGFCFMASQPFTNIKKRTNDVIAALEPFMAPEMNKNIHAFLTEKSKEASFTKEI